MESKSDFDEERSLRSQASCAKSESEDEMDFESDEDPRPKTIDLDMIWTMFRDLKQEFKNSRKSEKEEKKQWKKECIEQAAEAVNVITEDMDKELKEVKIELAHYMNRSEILAGICNGLHTEVQDLTQHIELLELNNSKQSVIMTGCTLDFDNKGENIEYLIGFFKQALQLDIGIEDYFHIGKSNPRPIVIEFETLEDKRAVMRSKSRLKSVNTGRMRIFINDYVPLPIQEKRKRERKIISDLEKDLDPDDEEADAGIAYTNAGLTINGVPYRKKITPPTPRELLDLEPEELKKVIKTQTKRGEAVVKDGSKFIGYMAPINSFQHIRNIYMKLKLIQPGARHIVCAYSFQDQAPMYATHNFHDDGEPGSGCALLDLMEKNGIENKVIFVVRKYGGIKLGAERFNCYLNAARIVLEITPVETRPSDINRTLMNNYNQSVMERPNLQQLEQNTVDTLQYERGKNRGRRGTYQNFGNRRRRRQQGDRASYRTPNRVINGLQRGQAQSVCGTRPPSTQTPLYPRPSYDELMLQNRAHFPRLSQPQATRFNFSDPISRYPPIQKVQYQ